MARGRRKSKREAGEARAAEAAIATAEAQAIADARSARLQRVLHRFATPREALDRLSVVSRDLDRIHREERNLLHERDDLVSLLRAEGQSWNAISSRTGLSRQALMKREMP